MNKSVIIVSEFVAREQNSTGHYWADIIDRLVQDFSEVKVVCASMPLSTKKNDLAEYIEVPSLPYNKKTLVGPVSRLITEIRLSWLFFWNVNKQIKSHSIIFTGTNPPTFLLLIYIKKIFSGFKWVILVHDVFPENLVAADILSSKNFIFIATRFLFNKIFALANSMIVIGRDMKDLMAEKTSYKVDLFYIPNWASISDVERISREKSQFINKSEWKDKIIFQFFGNLGRLQGIPNILEAIKLVKSKEAAFLFMGNGVMRGYLVDFISKNKDLNVLFLGEVKSEEKSEALSACDVAIVSLIEGMKGIAVPSKAYFSMAADKRLLVIGDEGAELSLVVKELDVGWFCRSGDPIGLSLLIDEICGLNLVKSNGFVFDQFKKNFTDDISLTKISKVLRSL